MLTECCNVPRLVPGNSGEYSWPQFRVRRAPARRLVRTSAYSPEALRGARAASPCVQPTSACATSISVRAMPSGSAERWGYQAARACSLMLVFGASIQIQSGALFAPDAAHTPPPYDAVLSASHPFPYVASCFAGRRQHREQAATTWSSLWLRAAGGQSESA